MRNNPARKIPKTVEVIRNLAERGVDLSEPHAVEHFFVGSPTRASEVAELLGKGGYEVINSLSTNKGNLFGITVQSAVDEDTIIRHMIDMCRIAEGKALGYDGWDVNVSRWKLK